MTKPNLMAQINEELAKSNFDFFFRIELNLHLIGQEMNHPGSELPRKIEFNKEKKTFSVEFSRKSKLNVGSLST